MPDRGILALLRGLAYLFRGFGVSLADNLSLGLLALGMSLVVWVFITTEQNPPRTGVFPTQITVQPVNVPAQLDLLGPIDPIVVRITGPSDVWSDLTEADFDATVDLSGLQQGESEVPVRVVTRDPLVRLIEVVPASVKVELDVLRQQVVPVQVNLQQGPPLGFEAETPRLNPEQVTVSGPERLVSVVDAAVLDLNLSSALTTVRQSLPLVPRTARGYDITGLRLEPRNVVVEVPITRQITYVTLPVVPNVQGPVQPRYWLTETRVVPTSVIVIGPQDVVQSLSVLRTKPINVTNITTAFNRSVELDLPESVSMVDRTRVDVFVTIEPVQGTAVFYAAPQIVGVASSLTARSEVSSVEVMVSGEGPLLQSMTAEKILVLASLVGRESGSHSVALQVSVPPGIRVVRINPDPLLVIVKDKDAALEPLDPLDPLESLDR